MNNKIFGYSWEEIERAQQRGGRLGRAIDTSKPARTPPTEAQLDQAKALLAEHGEAGLREKGFFGVLAWLEEAGCLGS